MFKIRPIQAADNEPIAAIIQRSLLEFNAAKPGTMYFDPTVHHTSEYFQKDDCEYFVAELDGKIVGGAGYFTTPGLPEGVVELVRLYLAPEARGKGIGKFLILHCESAARLRGYHRMYLETTKELNIAVPLYEKLGYHYIDHTLGESGHFGCEIRMLKSL